MRLSIKQQCRAARAYVNSQLAMSSTGKLMLQDPDFVRRLDHNFITTFAIFVELYGHREDCLDQLTELMVMVAQSYQERDVELKRIDKERELNSQWYLSNKMLGGVCYVDRYAENLNGVREKIPYFQELGLTYLHLMPLFESPEPLNDGGYAVSSYRDVKPILGNMDELKALAVELRRVGISLVVDLVFNHTSNEHEWAKKALAGNPEFEAYYWIFPDRQIPECFERTTREIFPDDHSGSFICLPDGRWVWSTFYHFQWDLNYSNPAVFRAMAREMLYLANIGIDFFRMDAVAFMWKRMGTTCENLPEVHKILRAFNSLCRMAAPSVLFKSEAIVHPDAVVQYIDTYECQISYNPLQMALTWEAMATRNAALLSQAIEKRHNISPGCAWVNYVRSHDDIGWTFADEDALELGKDGLTHRQFLNSFYVNRYQGSFARGVPFQDNPRTGDCRISGTTASLAGLEQTYNGAIHNGAIQRILLAYSIAMSTGGIPLIYLGDEVGQLNDYACLEEPSKKGDSRWVNRPRYPASSYNQRHDESTIPGKLYAGFQKLIHLRKSTEELSGGQAIVFRTENPAVLGYQRLGKEKTILCLANFSDDPQWIREERFSSLPEKAVDIVKGDESWVTLRGNRAQGVHLRAHQYMWLRY